MREAIGGFFPLDLPEAPQFQARPGQLWLNNGRTCLAYLLRYLQPECIYLPQYICRVVIDTVRAIKLPIHFYSINESLELETLPELSKRALLLYVDYFGLKQNYCLELMQHYPKQLLLDLTQALYAPHYPFYSAAWTFRSLRKWLGVPDGALLEGPNLPEAEFLANPELQYTYLMDAYLHGQQNAFKAYQIAEAKQPDGSVPYAPSALSRALWHNHDKEHDKESRQNTFLLLHEALAEQNALVIPASRIKQIKQRDLTPFCYPFLPKLGRVTHEELALQQIFIPRLWPLAAEVESIASVWEQRLSAHLLPLPIDSRLTAAKRERLLTRLSQSGVSVCSM